MKNMWAAVTVRYASILDTVTVIREEALECDYTLPEWLVIYRIQRKLHLYSNFTFYAGRIDLLMKFLLISFLASTL